MLSLGECLSRRCKSPLGTALKFSLAQHFRRLLGGSGPVITTKRTRQPTAAVRSDDHECEPPPNLAARTPVRQDNWGEDARGAGRPQTSHPNAVVSGWPFVAHSHVKQPTIGARPRLLPQIIGQQLLGSGCTNLVASMLASRCPYAVTADSASRSATDMYRCE